MELEIEENTGFYGENNLGFEVHNHKFPVDIEPPTPPTAWKYAVVSDAKASWQDQSKFMDDYQKEYMLNTKLMRNDIQYDITASSIGIDKVRLENYATWKTKGSVYTQRYDMQGKKWAANFMVPPMAANSELEGYAKFPNGDVYTIDGEDNSLVIPIIFGAEMKNLTDYARPEHVKRIKSELYIDNMLISTVEDTEKTKIDEDYNYLFTKHEGDEVVTLHITVKSSLLTKFTTDSALIDIKNYTITILCDGAQIEEDEPIPIVIEENDYVEGPTHNNIVYTEKYANYPDFPPPHIESVKIKKDGKELPRAKSTGKAFVCAGQTIEIELKASNFPSEATLEFDGDSSIYTFDKITKQFEWTEATQRGIKPLYTSLDSYEKIYSKIIFLEQPKRNQKIVTYKLTYVIPYETKQTLHSWNTLRNESNDAFNIKEENLFSRIKSPYQLVFKVKNVKGADTYRFDLDVFERWDTLYNRDLKPYIINY